MEPNAVLLFMDWTILRMFPPLRCVWAWRGQQADVPVTGENAKRVLFGAINVWTGHRILLRRKQVRQEDFQAFLRELRRRYRDRPIWLLLDRAGCQVAAKSQALAARLNIELVWLPKQSPQLNGMDHLWKEVKKNVSANRQYRTIDEHVQQAEEWIRNLSPRQALRKAGILSKSFWLRHF
jgi:transposase